MRVETPANTDDAVFLMTANCEGIFACDSHSVLRLEPHHCKHNPTEDGNCYVRRNVGQLSARFIPGCHLTVVPRFTSAPYTSWTQHSCISVYWTILTHLHVLYRVGREDIWEGITGKNVDGSGHDVTEGNIQTFTYSDWEKPGKYRPG